MDLVVVAGMAAAVVVATVAFVLLRRETNRRREIERHLDSLSSLTDPALARLAPDELFDELLARVRRALGADVASLLVLDAATDLLVVRASSGADGASREGTEPITVAVGEGLAGGVAAAAEPALANDVRPAEIALTVLHDGVRSFLGCPLLLDGEVCGVLAIGATRKGAFSTDDVRLARRVADRFAGAVERDRFDDAETVVRDALAETEHRIRTLVEAAPLGIIEAAIDGSILRWNRAAADLLGWPRWFEGMAAPDALPGDVEDAMRSAAGGHRMEGVSVTVERPGTRSVQLLASASPVTDREGNVEGVLVLLDDVTDRQQLEQHLRQSQRLEAMARLAGGVAHDFNNLLTVIRGYSEVLLKSLEPDDERREDVDAILVAGERAAVLTKQLLTIGRRHSMEPEVIDLHDHMDELAPMLQRLVGDTVELRVVVGRASGGGTVRVEPGDLDQAVMNLVNNAHDAMPDGGRIVVETRTIELRPRGASLAGVTAGRYVLLTVADTGPGMPKEVVEHCFDPFFTTKGRGKGTGLGLALVYGTATQAGGHATVESEVGRGTTFRMWLPEVDPTSAEPVAVAARPRRRRRSGVARKVRILLVEDEAPVRTLVRATLEDAGHEVIEAASAEEALAKGSGGGAADEVIDVLVSDVVLGGMTGDEAAVKLKKIWPGLRVVLMSGFTGRNLLLEPDAFVVKPFALDELAAVVGDLAEAGPAVPTRPRKRLAPRR